MMSHQSNGFFRGSTLIISVLAGAWTLFHLIWNLAGQTADDYWGIGLLILFLLALIFAFGQFASTRC